MCRKLCHNDDNMIEILEKAGLTKNEAKIYFALLQTGESSILQIAQKARLNRAVVHATVAKLVKSGALLESKKLNKRKISPRSPDFLREILQRKQREFRKKEIKLEEALPQLRQIHRKESPEFKVTILDGKKGVQTWVDLILEGATTEMLEFIRIEEIVQEIDPHLQNFYFPRKFEIGLPTRFLFIDTPFARKYATEKYLQCAQSSPMCCKFIPDIPEMMRGYKVIWNDNLAFFSSAESKTTILKDRNIANHERAFFNYSWNLSGEMWTNRPGESWERIVENFAKGRQAEVENA